jgi:hypothetical protein
MKRFFAIFWARFRRGLYLLFVGMWRGECGHDYTEFMDTGRRLVGIASGTRNLKNWRVWWRDPDNSIMELQDYWVKEHAHPSRK